MTISTSRHVVIAALLAANVVLQDNGASAQIREFADFFTGDTYCADSITVDINCGNAFQPLAGIRLLADLGIGALPFTGNLREFIAPNVGLEAALIGGWLAFQALYYPPMTTQFLETTPALLTDANRTVQVQSAIALGFSLVQGLLSFGGVILIYDPNSFRGASQNPSELAAYISINPVELTRWVASIIQRANTQPPPEPVTPPPGG